MSSKVCRLLLLFALLDAGLASRVIARAAAVSPTLASVHTAAQVPVQAARDALPIGLSDRFQWLSPTDLSQSLDDAVALGVGWLRVDLSWDAIQHQSPSVSDWSAFDRLVDAAAARGLHVLPILDRTPPWARPAGCDSDTCAPADPNQFAAFAAAATRRYAPRGVRTWEIWNEPSIDLFWKPAPDVARYVALLRPTVAAIQEVDPGATVISGGARSRTTTLRPMGGDQWRQEDGLLSRACARFRTTLGLLANTDRPPGAGLGIDRIEHDLPVEGTQTLAVPGPPGAPGPRAVQGAHVPVHHAHVLRARTQRESARLP